MLPSHARRLSRRVSSLLDGSATDAAYAAGWTVVRTLPEPVAHALFRAGADLAAGSIEPDVRTDSVATAPRRSARARRASDMDATVGGERCGGRRTPAHPYLARQMLDFGFRQTLKVRTLGCA